MFSDSTIVETGVIFHSSIKKKVNIILLAPRHAIYNVDKYIASQSVSIQTTAN